MPKPANWFRKLRRGRAELYLSDGNLHVHIRGPAKRARHVARDVKAWMESLPEETLKDRRYDPTGKSGAEPGDPEKLPGQRRLVEEPVK